MQISKLNNDLIFSKTVEEITKLISYGADVNAKNDEGKTALIHSTMHGSEASMKLLIDSGADVNAIYLGYTILMCAATHGSEASVKLLIDSGADVNAKTDCGETALMLANTDGKKKLIQDAIEAHKAASKIKPDLPEIGATASTDSTVQIIRVPNGTKILIEFY